MIRMIIIIIIIIIVIVIIISIIFIIIIVIKIFVVVVCQLPWRVTHTIFSLTCSKINGLGNDVIEQDAK